jgi:hypothetical protein
MRKKVEIKMPNRKQILIDLNEVREKLTAIEVVHGQWLDGCAVDNYGKEVYDSIDCSVCEEIFKIESHDREYWKSRFKVCPFCGAIMDLSKER